MADDVLAGSGLLSWLLPLIAVIAMPLILVAFKAFSKTSEGTISGTIKLDNVKADLTDVKIHSDKRFDRVEELIERKDDEHSQAFRQMWERIEKLTTDYKIHDYIIKELKSTKNGGTSAAI